MAVGARFLHHGTVSNATYRGCRRRRIPTRSVGVHENHVIAVIYVYTSHDWMAKHD